MPAHARVLRQAEGGWHVKPPATIGLVSLGCAKNAVDLQVMAGHLRKAGFALASNPDEADVVLVNTCAFIEQAREEAVSEILRACELKKSGRCRAVVVSGCFVQRYGSSLADTFPDVDAFLGIDALDRIATLVNGLGSARAKRVSIPCGNPRKVFSPPEPALRLTGPAFAYLKIAEGCAHRCSYCAIPAIRGVYRSRRVNDILAEARALVSTGVRELNVIAQDPMLYGVDMKPRRDGSRIGLVDLLSALDALEGDFRVRVLYSYPSEITDAFLDWMNSSPRAIRYVDVPIQHTAPSVLRAMARGSAVQATRTASARIRAAVPGVTLRTTVMTGFPGETEGDFKRLVADIRSMKFDHLGAFAFSPEEGTVAAELDGQVPHGVAERRRQEIMRVQKGIWKTISKGYVGKVFPALVVAPGVARLESQAPDVDGVTFIAPSGKAGPISVGSVVKLRITAVKGYDFEGIPAK